MYYNNYTERKIRDKDMYMHTQGARVKEREREMIELLNKNYYD
jgi:hypothetical protein